MQQDLDSKTIGDFPQLLYIQSLLAGEDPIEVLSRHVELLGQFGLGEPRSIFYRLADIFQKIIGIIDYQDGRGVIHFHNRYLLHATYWVARVTAEADRRYQYSMVFLVCL